jgi:MFS family permease
MKEPIDPSAFLGWRVVAGAFVSAAFGWGLGFYGPAIYLHAVMERTGWSVSLVSGAVTAHFLVGAVAVRFLPALHRQMGVATVTAGGAMVLGAGVIGWSLANTLPGLFLAALISGAGWVALGAASVNALISPWFERERPKALSTAYNGASVGGAVIAPLLTALLATIGFQAAAVLLALTLITTVCLLSATVFAKGPEDLGQLPDGVRDDVLSSSTNESAAPRAPAAVSWRDRQFSSLSLGMTFGLVAQVGLVAHLYQMTAATYGAGFAGAAMSAATVASVVGRLLVGWLMPPNAERRLIAAGSYAVQALGCAMILLALGVSAAATMIGVVLFGAGIGNATSLPPLIAQKEFRKEDVQRVVARIVSLSQGFYALAPVGLGMLGEWIQQSDVLKPFDAGRDLIMIGPVMLCQILALASMAAGRRKTPHR